MLRRFCLYGFVKNQKYFEPFFYLALLVKFSDSATAVGMLVGFGQLCVILMEVPSGAVADVLGRRRSMIFSHLAYIAAFLIFGLSQSVLWLYAAMFCFSIGEAFRTGTHKAMIFGWLNRQGRGDEKTKIYGLTRSFSQLGSALSIVIAAILVFTTQQYAIVFLVSALPYVINVVNFLTYPEYLDGPGEASVSPGRMLRTMFQALGEAFGKPRLRRALAEAMTFGGMYKSSKDWLGPLLGAAALQVPLFAYLTDRRREAILVGAVYVVLYVLSSFASRNADAVVRRAGSPQKGSRWLWWMNLATFAALGAGIAAGISAVAIAAFVALAMLQNFWRPIIVSRVAQHTGEDRTATVLSIESQSRTLFTAAAAPLLGWAIDMIRDDMRFLPLAVLGVAITLVMLATGRKDDRSNQDN